MEAKTDKPEPLKPVQRLCNEIQLFDLCDLERCDYKEGRFCTKTELLSRFERISEKEEVPKEQYLKDEFDEDNDPDDGDLLGTYGFNVDTEDEDHWEEG